MKILDCYIENFGTLSAKRFEFCDGLNVLREDNGFGKSTLFAFISAMLYGLSDTKKAKLSENDRKKYTPWQGGAFGGYMTVLLGDKEYRIERSFGKKASDDTVRIFELATGLEAKELSELGEVAFGIDRDGFERTVLLSEKELSDKNENKTIAAKLSDLTEAQADMSELGEADALLDEARKYYQKQGGGGIIPEIEAKIAAISENEEALRALTKELELDTENIRGLRGELGELYKKRDEARATERLEGEKKLRREIAKQYSRKSEQLALERERLSALRACFGDSLPTHKDLDEAKNVEARLEQLNFEREKDLKEEIKAVSVPEGLTREAIDRAAYAKERLAEARAQREAKEEELSGLREPFSEEEKKSFAKLEKKANQSVYSNLLLGIFLILLGGGLAFVSLYFLAVSAVGVFFVILYKIRKKDVDWVHGLLMYQCSQLNLRDDGSTRAFAARIRGEIEKRDEHAKRRLEIEAEIAEIENGVRGYLEEFESFSALVPEARGEDAVAAARALLDESISRSEAERIRGEQKKAAEAERLSCIEALSDFEERFGRSDGGLDGMRERLREYESCSENVRRMSAECSAMKLEYGITDEDIKASGEEVREEPTENIDLKISELEKRLAILLGKYERDSETVSELDILAAEREKLENKLALCRSKLETIKKARKFLSDAASNLTARYLGPTRTAFNRYAAEISESDEELLLDTAFTPTKTDLGQTRPKDAYSRGTKELFGFALRLALIDSLYEKEKPPLLLDDPFAYYDDGRFRRAANLTRRLSADRQIIYLTATDGRKI